MQTPLAPFYTDPINRPKTVRPLCINHKGIPNHPINQEIRNIQTDNNYHNVQSAYYNNKRNNNSVYTKNNANKADSYYNPYEYGARQNEFGLLYKEPYIGPYDANPKQLCDLGVSEVSYEEIFPGAVRNINVESSLLQREMTHTPGQRIITETEINRFELLPFDPQDTRHIVWKDNMPRGGYPSRADRLELL